MSWVDDWIRPGMTAFDLGACHGLFTKQFVEAVGPTGRVYAIEPQPDLRPALLALTPHVLTLAIGDQDGETSYHASDQSEHGSLWIDNVLDYRGRSERIRMATLDGLQRSGELPGWVDVIKVDIQGAEAAMLAGAEPILHRQRPVWYVELWPEGLRRAGASAQWVCDQFRAANYLPDGQTYDTLLQTVLGQQGHASVDALFLPEERI